MADYFCQFSCVLDVGSPESAEHADAIRGELAAELDRHEGAALGFEMEIDHETGPGALWIHADEYGDPEHVTRFVPDALKHSTSRAPGASAGASPARSRASKRSAAAGSSWILRSARRSLASTAPTGWLTT
jgi:hypothetical protein